MARTVFFSFHYQNDVWRINQVRNIPNITGNAAAGFKDASLWEEAKSKSDDAVKKMIDNALYGTSVTVVFIGEKTANRKFINYEIQKSLERGNGLLGIYIHHLLDQNQKTSQQGAIPKGIVENGFRVYRYTDVHNLAKQIEEAAKIAGK